MTISFPAFVAGKLGTDRFSLLDVGCSGGIDPQWRAFEPYLRCIGIDASVTECERLKSAERNPDIAYVAAYVSRAADVPVDHSQGPAAPLIMRLRDRLSFMRTREIRDERLRHASTEEQLRHNAWEMTGLADPTQPIVVPELLAERGWSDLDYLKIDIDGGDFEILQSFAGRFDALGVIAAQLEVNFIGTEQPHEHTFHNTDRFMRRHGFDLFRLDVRTCSTRALPARYIWPTPAETVSGRPFQGEAYYARDVLAPHRAAANAGLGATKLAKLAAVFSLWDVPDAAADLLVNRRDALAPLLDIDAGLDLLAAQTQADRMRRPLSYRDYMASFEADAKSFYRPEGPIPLRERLASAWRGYWYPRERRR
ncbi:MAG: FkbM family methyltransferase [Reyranella sp.]|uniref:FkbM family methyltransferase n=1 Tax=Reyranella sp. TaxID=1929291 RepID=UPI003D11CEAD